MKQFLLVLCLGVASFGAAARGGDPADGLLRHFTPEDVEFGALAARYPGLGDARLIVAREGRLIKIVMPTDRDDLLLGLAHTLLQQTDPHIDATLFEDDAQAKRFATSDLVRVRVLQHRIGDVPVMNSRIFIRTGKDGTSTLLNALIPTAPGRPKAPFRGEGPAAKDPLHATAGGPSSADNGAELAYVRGADGVARLSYRDAKSESPESARIYRSVESGSVLREEMRLLPDFDISDQYWTDPPTTYVGKNVITDLSALCKVYPLKEATDYYQAPPYLLNAPVSQVNIAGPAERMRAPSMGLTAVRWTDSYASLAKIFESGDFEPFRTRIFRSRLCNDDLDVIYPEPMEYGSEVPYSFQQKWEYMELQTAMTDLHERFGWLGLHNSNARLLLVLGMTNAPHLCATASSATAYESGLIFCTADVFSLINGLPERIPPIDTFAHEFAHTILTDRGLDYHGNAERTALSEALADILALSVKSFHEPGDVWRYASQPAFMDFLEEWFCSLESAYCGIQLPSIRDIAHPKTNDPIHPSPNFYGYGQNFNLNSAHRSGQVVSYMLYLLAEGSTGGARDDDPGKGTYGPFVGTGFESMLEIVYKSLDNLPALSDATPMKDFASAVYETAAYDLCDRWSYEALAARQAAWIVNLSGAPANYADTGYFLPKADQVDVLPLVKIAINGYLDQPYAYEVATDAFFTNVVQKGSGKLPPGNVFTTLKLDPYKTYWLRVRRADAPLIQSKWVVQDSACWRPALRFSTGGPAVATNMSPAGVTSAQGDEVEPWGTKFSWSGDATYDGYELWVDDEEPPEGKYKKVWAHKIFRTVDLAIDKENPGTKDAPHFAPVILPLPKQHNLCWKLVPFMYGTGMQRLDGEPREQCFHTREPQTVITHPAAADANGVLSEAPGQPLTIQYDPADFAHDHEFYLQAISLGVDGTVPATGELAYLDDPSTDPANTVLEAPGMVEWLSRTRERMLPVDIASGAHENFGLYKARLTVRSHSPRIADPANGGTYPAFVEKVDASVEFHPTTSDFNSLHPVVYKPAGSHSCSDPASNDVSLAWQHGAGATADVVAQYQVDLFPQTCGSAVPGGLCQPLADPKSPQFYASLFDTRVVPHNGEASQEIAFSRSQLFPTEAAEADKAVTGFLARLRGISGKLPGPAGLPITPTFVTDLPVLPDKLGVHVYFNPPPDDHPDWQYFVAESKSRKNPDFPLVVQGPYYSAANHVAVTLYDGPGCIKERKIRTDPDSAIIAYGQSGYPAGTHPVVSARATLQWQGCAPMQSACEEAEGFNPNAKPDAVAGAVAQQQGTQLGLSWNPPNDPSPGTVVYQLLLSAAGNDASNILANPPGPLSLALPMTQTFDSQIGTWLATLTPADEGKDVVIAIKACRASNNLCSAETLVGYHITTYDNGGGNGVPLAPQDVAFHFSDDLGVQLQQAVGYPPSSWMFLSWNPPASGPTPTYYAVTTFGDAPLQDVLLPTFLAQFGAAYPGSPYQYAAIVPHSADSPAQFSLTQWATYAWPLGRHDADTGYATTLHLTLRACTGPLPTPDGAYGWIVSPDFAACGNPTEIDAALP